MDKQDGGEGGGNGGEVGGRGRLLAGVTRNGEGVG